jgi:hypothetical protein
MMRWLRSQRRRTMPATEAFQQCLTDAFKPMHVLRRRRLLRALEAVTGGLRLRLIGVAR